MPHHAPFSCRYKMPQLRAGFTLLEVMLALALSALLLGAIGVAVQVHLRAVESGRVEIEQAQIARAVLDRIADDLRGALQHTTVDTSQLKMMAAASAAVKGNTDALAAAAESAGLGSTGSGGSSASGSSSGTSGSSSGGSTSGSGASTSGQSSGQSGSGSSKGSTGASSGSSSKGGTTGGSSTGGASTGATGTTSSGGSTSGTTTGSTDSSSSTDGTGTPAPVPGIYGSEYQIQVDVSRLPRPDEYGGVIAGGANPSNAAAGGVPISVPHDVRTVTYYLNTQAQAASNMAGSTGGLMRRELHRSAAIWGSQQGIDPTYDAHSASLAPEVTALEFRYLDGTEWVSEWDTSAAGCLPAAIEVAVTIGMPADSAANTSSLTTTVGPGRQAPSELVVRRVIFLPGAGQPASTAAPSSADPSATGDASTSSSSGSSSASGTGS